MSYIPPNPTNVNLDFDILPTDPSYVPPISTDVVLEFVESSGGNDYTLGRMFLMFPG